MLLQVGLGPAFATTALTRAPLFSLLIRYAALWRKASPLTLIRVNFPGVEAPQRGVEAKSAIPRDAFILEMSGHASATAPFVLDASGCIVGVDTSSGLAKFSLITRGKGGRQYIALLVGPIRFLNHQCNPNCEVTTLPSFRLTG